MRQVKIKMLLLVGGDAGLAVLALYAGLLIRFGSGWPDEQLSRLFWVKVVLFVFVLVAASELFELYNLDKHRRKREIFINSIIAVCVSFVVLSTIFFINREFTIGRGLLGISLASFVFFQYVWHVIFAIGIGHPFLAERVVIVGTGVLAATLGNLILSSAPRFNNLLLGYVTGENDETCAVPADQIIGSATDLMAIAMSGKAAKIVVSVPEREGIFPIRNVLLNCKLHGIEVIDMPTFYEQVTGKLMLENMEITWLIYSTGFKRTALMSAVKRMVDIVLSSIGILVALPLLPLIALLVKLDSPGPLLFSQRRVGQGEANFILYKFRTMIQNVEDGTGAAWAQEDDPRVSRIGKFLRKFRLDEIPQLYNILKGDMSFVGPRPERPEFVVKLDQLIPFYRKRHFIKPGLTGWAQVNFGYGASVDDAYEKLRYDLYYIKNMSPLLDTIIFIQTFKVVIFRRGGR